MNEVALRMALNSAPAWLYAAFLLSLLLGAATELIRKRSPAVFLKVAGAALLLSTSAWVLTPVKVSLEGHEQAVEYSLLHSGFWLIAYQTALAVGSLLYAAGVLGQSWRHMAQWSERTPSNPSQ